MNFSNIGLIYDKLWLISYIKGDVIMDKTQTQQTPVNLLVNVENLKTEFSDLVQFEAFQEYMILNFLQTFPNAMPAMPINDGIDVAQKPERMAKIVSRIAIPWDHFVRLIPAMILHAQQNKDSANEQFEKAREIFAGLEQK